MLKAPKRVKTEAKVILFFPSIKFSIKSMKDNSIFLINILFNNYILFAFILKAMNKLNNAEYKSIQ